MPKRLKGAANGFTEGESHCDHRQQKEHRGDGAQYGHPGGNGSSEGNAPPACNQNEHPINENCQIAAGQIATVEFRDEVKSSTEPDERQPDHKQVLGVPPGDDSLSNAPYWESHE